MCVLNTVVVDDTPLLLLLASHFSVEFCARGDERLGGYVLKVTYLLKMNV
jgi:hypothetical protein